MRLNIAAVPQELMVEPQNSALIVIDMQNAFCHPDGMFGGVMLDIDKTRQVIQNDVKVLAAARAKGLKVIYLQMGFGPDMADAGSPDSPNYWKESSLVALRQHPERRNPALIVGSWQWQIIDELKPHTGDVLINKTRYSGFTRTGLKETLNHSQIRFLFLVGLYTNICVESTLRDAYFEEFFPILIQDACGPAGPAGNQQASVWAVQAVFGWLTTTDEFVIA
jgi:ureidoacrylate peracid hydrolase